MKKSIPVLIALILVLGCDGSGDSGNGGIAPPGAEAYFPLQGSNRWQFAGIEVDSLENLIPGTEYTRLSTVVGDTLISNRAYFILRDSTDMGGVWHEEGSQYVRIDGDTVKFLMSLFDDPEAMHEVNMAILPSSVGETWNAFSLDTVMEDPNGDPLNVSLQITGELLAIGAVTVPVGTLEGAVHIGQVAAIEISNPDTTLAFTSDIKFWLAPNVGLARMYEAPITGPDGYANGMSEELVEFVVGALP